MDTQRSAAGPASGASPPGLDLARLTEWFDRELPGRRTGELSAEVIAGGRSNLTYRLTDGTNRWALRRPPMGHVLPTAHDMAREFTVISALHGSAVPVPEPVALCPDRGVLGEPFYLMSFVDGIVLDEPAKAGDLVTARRSTEALVDTLVALHAIAPEEVGLEAFGRPEGFLQRQIGRWHKQFRASLPEGGDSEGGDSEASATEDSEANVVAALSDRLPPSGRAGIVHGDYRLTNVLFEPDLGGGRATIAAVVDWEMATLGDPLTDVGLLYVYHERSRASAGVMPDFPAAQGFLSPEAMVRRYADASGIDVAALDWHIAFGYFKLSVIAAGIAARYRQGLTVGEGFEVFGALRDDALAAAARKLGEF
jgi:aminoglycoside phosphotransferase (APT) family kinase protein